MSGWRARRAKYSFLLTVYDREPAVLLATLRGLQRCDLSDCEVIVVNDGSHYSYEWARGYMSQAFPASSWVEAEPYEAFRIVDGFNNPARAFNLALDAATGDDVVILSSDVIIGPKVLERIRRVDLNELAWVPLTIDMDTGQQYCGPMRLFPMPWCLATTRAHALAIGGWDETYLQGMCYEDNDFVGRLVLHTGRFLGDWTVAAYHQSHDQPAYDVKDPEVLAANLRNKQYTMEKWSGIPFSPECIPFDVLRKPHPSGNVVHECRAVGTLLADTIAKTKGLIADKLDDDPLGSGYASTLKAKW